ncbi:MAG: MmgE/PrpD family protein [Desulfobacterales bacterium]|nr:MmgE/PrpD family protein [Desulfobacterales bacterium]
MDVTRQIAEFAADIDYHHLDRAVVTEVKRLLLDTIGCALGALKTEKGLLAVQMARHLKGPAEAWVPGAIEKMPAASAAYVMGELINALDYDALLSPPDHATPYVLAAPLAVGQAQKVTGRHLIIATAIAHETALRISRGLVFGSRFHMELPDKGLVLGSPTPGYGMCVFGGTAACGKLLGLNADKIAHALGIAGYNAPVPMLAKYACRVPSNLNKFLSAGLLSQMEVVAALSAGVGLTGDTGILDGNCGFWKGFGCDGWRPEYVVQGLGETWIFPDRLFYKIYPCCGAMQYPLFLFAGLLREHGIGAEDISALEVKMNLLAELPLWHDNTLENHVDAQFNIPFVFAALAHGIEVGPEWQMPEIFKKKEILTFMNKVRVITSLSPDFASAPDVKVMVKSGTEQKIFSTRGHGSEYQTGDDVLIAKFLRNTRHVIEPSRAEKIIEGLQQLEHIEDISTFFSLMAP